MLVLVVLLVSTDQGSGQKPDHAKTIYAVPEGEDTVISMPKGMEYKIAKSRVLGKELPKPEILKDERIRIKGRTPVFVPGSGDDLTLRVGSRPGTVEIGIPPKFFGSFSEPQK